MRGSKFFPSFCFHLHSFFTSALPPPLRFWPRAEVWSACESTFRNGIPTPRCPRCNGGLARARTLVTNVTLTRCVTCHEHIIYQIDNYNVFLIQVKCFAYYHDWVGVDTEHWHGDCDVIWLDSRLNHRLGHLDTGRAVRAPPSSLPCTNLSWDLRSESGLIQILYCLSIFCCM